MKNDSSKKEVMTRPVKEDVLGRTWEEYSYLQDLYIDSLEKRGVKPVRSTVYAVQYKPEDKEVSTIVAVLSSEERAHNCVGRYANKEDFFIEAFKIDGAPDMIDYERDGVVVS